MQRVRKEQYDKKLPSMAPIFMRQYVLFYNSKHKKFPSKLHTRWMGPFRAVEVYDNWSLQLEDLEGKWLNNRVNGSQIKRYYPPEDL